MAHDRPRKEQHAIQKGAKVETRDGKGIGRIDRVVIDPASGDVTHFVARKGLILVEFKLTPPGTVALKVGAHVTTRDGQDVGRVEEIITEEHGERITYW